MIIRVSPSTLRGEVQAPPSKSVMQRLVAGALLADGTSTLDNISQSDDCTASLMLASQLGAEIEIGEQRVSISGTGRKLLPRTEVLTPGESGLAARLFTPIAGLAPKPLRMEAEGTLVQRPMAVYESLFDAYGGQLSCLNGAFPVEIAHPLEADVQQLAVGVDRGVRQRTPRRRRQRERRVVVLALKIRTCRFVKARECSDRPFADVLEVVDHRLLHLGVLLELWRRDRLGVRRKLVHGDRDDLREHRAAGKNGGGHARARRGDGRSDPDGATEGGHSELRKDVHPAPRGARSAYG